jgi:hypothetical protein
MGEPGQRARTRAVAKFTGAIPRRRAEVMTGRGVLKRIPHARQEVKGAT